MTGIWAIVPIKDTHFSKSRLAPVMSDRMRRQLALIMFEDVLTALLHAPGLEGIMVPTPDAEITRIGRRYGVEIMAEPTPTDYNRVARQAACRIAEQGGDAALILPADIPLLTSGEVQAVLSAASAMQVAILAARDGIGTNGLLLRGPDVMEPHFGIHSLHRHRQIACSHGLSHAVMDFPGFGFDIDTSLDIYDLWMLASPTETGRFVEQAIRRGEIKVEKPCQVM